MRAPEEIWYGNQPVPWHLSVLEKLYRPLAAIHQRLRRLKAGRVGVPVVVIGNLTVGGSGKTPLLIHLVNLLKSEFSIGVVSRGYGSSAGRGPIPVNQDSDAASVGDEPKMIWQGTGVPVMVGSNRLDAANVLVKRQQVDLIFSDDGLQHHQLGRDLEIVVVDAARGFGNRRQIPAGPLREPLERLKSVDFVIKNGAPESMTLVPGNAVLLNGDDQKPLSSFAAEPVHAVAGIGHPERFFTMLEAAGLAVHRHPFDDHHAYQLSDLAALRNETVLTTAKDATKLAQLGLTRCWIVPVSVQLAPALAEPLLKAIRSLEKPQSIH
ncbi:MAG: tetraacyldisaccharide 4'-kinase [Lysobacterales bacterium]